MIARILKNAGLDPILYFEKVEQVRCNHDELFDHLEKRARVLKTSNYKDKSWSEILSDTARHNPHEKQIKQLQKLNQSKINWFWQTIENIGWKKDLDSERTRARLDALNLKTDALKELENIASMYYVVLEHYMDEKFGGCVPTPGSDDSYSDFIWSAVGLGKEFYFKLFSEFYTWPRAEMQYATEESFSYIFRDDDK